MRAARLRGAFLLAAMLGAIQTPEAAPFDDALVQSPNLGQPQRGSLAGTLSQAAFRASDLVRGSFVLPLPLAFPEERGPLLADVTPSYSADAGLSEWGMGWQAKLVIERHRDTGDLDYQTDGFSSPWGRLELGSDGAYYPRGLAAVVRATIGSVAWEAQTPDGTLHRFQKKVLTPRGTYAWMLTEVETVLGDVATLTWTSNSTGRPFLTRVRWGGRGSEPQYEMSLEYETLPTPRESYASGTRLDLDRRVARVIVRARSGGAFRERWRHVLGYTPSPLGPAFYLTTVDTIYPSNQAEPTVRYDYDMGAEALASAPQIEVTGLDALIAQRGTQALRPDRTALTDLEDDGLADLEIAYDEVTWHQTSAGQFVPEALPPPTGAEHPLCRAGGPSSINAPRRLVRVHPSADEPQVVATSYLFGTDTTTVMVCDRAGLPLFSLPLFTNWRLGPTTRLVDVDRDRRPDLVRVLTDRIDVLPNASEGVGAIAFGAMKSTALTPAIPSPAVWLLDTNGDGKTDLVKRTSQGFWVWAGRGEGLMVTEGRLLQVEAADGQVIVGIDTLHASFGDYNNDGLIDAVMTRPGDARVYIHRGDRLVERPVPALAGAPLDFDATLVADLTGGGEEEVLLADAFNALAVRLTTPSTGLLRQADDGRGNRLTFTYQRATPSDGVARRPAVLDEVTAESAGSDPVITRYDYADPVLHRQGRYLVGYGEVAVIAPLVTEIGSFANDDDVAGLPLSLEIVDERAPGLVQIERSTLEDAAFQGLRWRREVERTTGWRGEDGHELVTTHRVLEYQRDICATKLEEVLPGSTLRRERQLASVSGLDDRLHCLASSEDLIGEHTDGALDFRYGLSLARNDFGQVTRVEQRGGGETLLLQENTYNPTTHRLESVSAPGRGVHTLGYEPATGLLESVTAADGVVTAAQERDATTDALRELLVDHGPTGVHRSSFRYDPLERLHKRWTDFGGSSEANPLETLSYRFPTLDNPGLVQTDQLVDVASGARREVASWIRPDGGEITSATWQGDGWAFGPLTTRIRAQRIDELHRRQPLPPVADLPGQTYESLRSATTLLSERTLAGLGHEVARHDVIQEGVTRDVTTVKTLVDDVVLTSVVENGAFETRAKTDAAGRLRSARDATGGTTQFRHDALGRLVGVTLADGTRHRVSFDPFGRPAVIERDRIGSVVHRYQLTTGLLAGKDYQDASGQIEHSVDFAYDAVGRVREQTYTKAASGAQNVYTFRYDGERDSSEPAAGQTGYLTEVIGPSHKATTIRHPNGSQATSTIVLADWMKIEVSSDYYANGAPREIHRTIQRLSDGAILDDVVTGHVYDTWGRLHQITVNQETLATLSYDPDGSLASIDLASGDHIAHEFDPATRRQTGYHQSGGSAPPGGMAWAYNSRGLVDSETIDLGDQSWLRTYRYDPRGFLTRSEDPDHLATYTYTVAGLPNRVTDDQGTRTVHRGTASTLTVGGIAYTWDAVGRVTARGDATFHYGPDGHLAVATKSQHTLAYAYDDQGNRLLKYRDGAPIAGYFDGGYLTENAFVAPVAVGGRVLGVLENGHFRPLSTDPRGTVLADEDGPPRLPSPYGSRPARPDVSVAIDYVEKSYDDDLAAVRMGVRDYDPVLGQFWTPDPLYLEAIDGCKESPVDCNLFGYARNNPLAYVDPLGTMPAWLERLGEAIADKALEWDNDYKISARSEAFGKVSEGTLIAIGGCATVVLCKPAIVAGGIRAGEGVHEFAAGQDRPNAVEAVAGRRAGQLFNEGVDAASMVGLGWGLYRAVLARAFSASAARAVERVASREAAEAARDVAGRELGRKHATYTGGYKDGKVVTGCSRNPTGCAEDDVARQLGPDAQMTKAMGWRRNKGTGELEWTEIPVCPNCQGKYSPSQFPRDTKADPGGSWKRK